MYDHPPAPPPLKWVRISHHPAKHVADRWPYAAYGSNLDLAQMGRRCPQAEIIGPGTLSNARLVFEQVATIVADERSTCPVGVYRLNAVDVASMDRSEGLGRAYDRYLVTVETPGALLRCFTYIKKDTRLGPPSQSYYDRIRSGYRQWGFDEQRVYRAARKARDLRVVPKHNFDHDRWPWEPLGTSAPARYVEEDERIANSAPRIRLDENMSPLEFKNEVLRYSAAKRAHTAFTVRPDESGVSEFTNKKGEKWRKIGNGPWERY